MSAPTPSAPTPGVSTPSAGPSGLVYADVPNRIIAYIIDAIIVGILNLIVGIVLGGLGLQTATLNPDLTISVNYLAAFVAGIVGLLISAGYFIYTWTRMRATVGMRLLGMQIGNAGDGKTMTTEQGIRRYIALAAPAIIAQVFQPIPLIGIVVGLAGLVWYIWLIYTMAQSPTKQGWQDIFANTQVVKAARSV
jgi:uncharacterized RDD family membrane protein YckC